MAFIRGSRSEFSPGRKDEGQLTIPSIAEAEPEQLALIDVGEWWDEHWQGMPEFVSGDQRPFKTIYVHFENRDAMKEFAELVEQRVALDTAWIWFPKKDRLNLKAQEYVGA